MDLHEGVKLMGATVLGRPSYSHGFYLQEHHQVLKMKILEKVPLWLLKDGWVIIVKYAQSISGGKDITRAISQFEVDIPPTPAPSAFLIHLKGAILLEKHL